MISQWWAELCTSYLRWVESIPDSAGIVKNETHGGSNTSCTHDTITPPFDHIGVKGGEEERDREREIDRDR